MDDITQVVQKLKDAKRVLFTTGAGISVASGIPTYRGVGGLYDDDFTKDGINVTEVLSGHKIREDPHLVWTYILRMEKACRNAQPNDAHHIIMQMEQKIPEIIIFTQNVDGLHHIAGSRNIIDIHGSLRELYCMNLDCEYMTHVNDYANLGCPPRCPMCNNIIRPNVILFGEMLPGQKLSHFAREMEKGFDVAIVIGTTGTFPYITMPLLKLRSQGTFLVEINPDNTTISEDVDIKINQGASEALQSIWQLLN